MSEVTVSIRVAVNVKA